MTEMSPSLYPPGEKNGHWTCFGLWGGATGHVIACHWFIFPHFHTQIPANHLSVLACRDATSSEHQSSSLHPRLFSLCWITGVSSRPAQPWAPRSWEIFGTQFIMLREAAHNTLLSSVEWHRDGYEIPCFPRMYFSGWMHAHYSNTSSPVRP